MPLRSSLASGLLLLGSITATGQAQDIAVTPRLSVGVAKGMGITESEFNTSMQSAAALYGSASGTYSVKSAINTEFTVIFSKQFHGSWSFMGGPGLVYSKNTNDFSMTANGSYKGLSSETIEGTDEYKGFGGKLYAGVGVGDQIGFHAECLPFIGFASVKETIVASGTAKTSGGSTLKAPSSSTDSTGTMTLYGITVGGYYTTPSHLQFGARLGYVGASGKIDDASVEQNGLLAAAEIGYVF